MTILLRESRFMIRRWRRSPASFIVALVSFTVGIAACIAAAAVFDAILLRPLPVRDAKSLVKVVSQNRDAVFSTFVWHQFRDQQSVLDNVAAVAPERLELASQGESRLVDGLYVSGNLLDLLGVGTVIGRRLTLDDDRNASVPVCMIGYTFWQREFGGSLNVLGQRVVVDNQSFEIVGVTSREFFGIEVGRNADVLLPASAFIAGARQYARSSTAPWLHIIGRLRAGETLSDAAVRLRAWQPALSAGAGDGVHNNLREPLSLARFDRGVSTLGSEFGSPALTLLVAAAVALFLIACGNVAALKIAALLDELPEFAIRQAMGASRRQLFVAGSIDVLAIALIGAAAGMFLAMWAIGVAIPLLATPLDRGLTPYLSVAVDSRMAAVVLLSFVVSATGIACLSGLLVTRMQRPATRYPATLSVKRLSGRVVIVVLVLQVAFAVMLVAAAGLLTRSFIELTGQSIAINPEGVVLASLNRLRFESEPVATYARIEALIDGVRSIPGVEAVSASTLTPLSGLIMLHRLEVPGVPITDLRDVNTSVNRVTPEFFEVFGTPIVLGRDFNDQDGVSPHRVAVVNAAFASHFFGDVNPVGRLITLNDVQVEIVGVVATGKYMTLREPTMRFVYVPFAQWIGPRAQPVRLAARGLSDRQLRLAILEGVRRYDPRITVEFRTLTDEIAVGSNRERLLALTATAFGSLSLLVAAVGIYGSLSYSVIRRTREFGVRTAVGASPRNLFQLVCRSAGLLLGSGIVLGLVGLLAARRLIGSALYAVEPDDPLSLVAAVAVMLAVGAAAAYLPARRASKLEPATSLREP